MGEMEYDLIGSDHFGAFVDNGPQGIVAEVVGWPRLAALLCGTQGSWLKTGDGQGGNSYQTRMMTPPTRVE